MENKDKTRFIIWLLVVIIILMGVAVSVLLYKIVATNGTQIIEESNNINSSIRDESEKINTIEESEISKNVNKYGIIKPAQSIPVYSYIDLQKIIKGGSAYNTDLHINLRVPQLNYTTDAAKKINEKILSDFNDYLQVFDEEKYVNEKMSLADIYMKADYEYSYVLSENRVYITAEKVLGNSNASGGTDYFMYIYDIDEDRELTINDVFSEKKITLEKIKAEIYNNYEFKENYNLQTQQNKADIDNFINTSLNDNFKNVIIKSVRLDKRWDDVRAIYLKVYTNGRESYDITIGLN